MRACLCICASMCVCPLAARPSLHIISLTTLPAPRGLPAWPRVTGTVCFRSLRRAAPPSESELPGGPGLCDSQPVVPTQQVWEPLADLLPVTCPPQHQPPSQSPSPRAQLLRVRLSFLDHRESPLEPFWGTPSSLELGREFLVIALKGLRHQRWGRALRALTPSLPSPVTLFT